ncbi:MAG TPA: PDZ domain-containing protein [Acidimicrobiales bacterium]|nr:PDZ domain-containing protein [Acidimicrobiales bacterium]
MSSTEPTLPPPPIADSRRRRRRRWPLGLLVVTVLLAAAVLWSVTATAPYYELLPGQAQEVSQLITVPKGAAHPLHGQVLLTDVEVDTMKYLQFVPAYFDSDATVVPTGELTGNLPLSEFNAEGTVDMEESQQTAAAVALRQLGYAVPERDVGTTVYVVDPGSPAWDQHALQVGDVVTAIDGVPTPNPDALVSALDTHEPGQTVILQVGSVQSPLPGRTVKLVLGSLTDDGTTKPLIGIGEPSSGIPSMGTQALYSMPFSVSINSDNIGGPSAGLAFTLGIINTLSGGHLTGGHVVAATGTIDPDGSVGDVGGVAQKTVAVERAGATLFLVPPEELSVARSKATGKLKVEAVSNIGQALADLARIGGQLGAAAKGPVSGNPGHGVPFDWQDSPWS